MKDAIGGLFSIQAIVIFVIIVNCFLAFSVNYTKAFRAKNEVRSIIEKNEGFTCQAKNQISEVLNNSRYRISDGNRSWCERNGYYIGYDSSNTTPLFCYKVEKVDLSGGSDAETLYKGAYYTIVTFVNIDIPLFSKIFPGMSNIFSVKGETALIYSSGVDYEGLDKACDS